MVVSPLWRGPGNIHGFDKDMYICIYMYKGSGTYPCALLSRQFLTVENTKKNTSAQTLLLLKHQW